MRAREARLTEGSAAAADANGDGDGDDRDDDRDDDRNADDEVALLQRERAREVAKLVCTSGLSNCYCRSGRTKPIERVDPRDGSVADTYCSGADAARKLTALLRRRHFRGLDIPDPNDVVVDDDTGGGADAVANRWSEVVPSPHHAAALPKKVQYCSTGAPDDPSFAYPFWSSRLGRQVKVKGPSGATKKGVKKGKKAQERMGRARRG